MLQKVKERLVLPIVALAILGLALAPACISSGDSPSTSTPTQGETELSGKITEAGSTSILPLAEKFALAFMAKHPKVRVIYTGGGSGAGVKQCAEGTVDLGATSRYLKTSEADLISYPIARDGVAIIVNIANPINGLTLEQAAKIFGGEITIWSEISGEAGKITVYTREEGSGTRDCFEHGVTKKYGKRITAAAIAKKSNGEIQMAVQGDASSIGYVSLSYIEGVKALALEGKKCTVEACKSGDYPIVRRLYFHTKGTPSELEKAFIDFCRGAEGQKIVKDMSYIRLVC
jgi:phosphate transport system substrate-binding protein